MYVAPEDKKEVKIVNVPNKTGKLWRISEISLCPVVDPKRKCT